MARKGEFTSSTVKACEVCGKETRVANAKLAMGWGRFCGRACKGNHQTATGRGGKSPLQCRSLLPGEPIPGGQPRRYISAHGYIRLRWKVGTRSYVEAYEHRLNFGLPARLIVHHKNEDKTDNRPENLEAMTIGEHITHHHKGKPNPRKRNMVAGRRKVA